MSEQIKTTIDGATIVVTVGAIVQWLPAVAAVLSIFWTLIRIYETRTIQKLLKRID